VYLPEFCNDLKIFQQKLVSGEPPAALQPAPEKHFKQPKKVGIIYA